jgi:uncharacterized protein DUF4440
MTFKAIGVALAVIAGANAQQGRWAAAGDPIAKSLIDMERQWAEEACTHNLVVQTILADDFQGTSPEGKLYSKAEAVDEAKANRTQARECRLKDAKVRFFGDNVAIVYGNESSVMKARDGKESTRSLVWTDTWLKRNGKWQIIAVQDMPTDGI